MCLTSVIISLLFTDKLLQTPMSCSAYFIHMNPEIFPEPESFEPERWLRAAERGEKLHRYLVSFSAGSRQCVGMKYVLSTQA